ncbi:FAD-binding and (Fe-S)-binding domain-containing protein [Halomarina litorea]|uniref:FAD-binding and (Fe-S)-binding domain-containing protein n=1 Tax=Halomarina litorea TaxID=2961595 RepID=UPI0020C48507|nr:FAD-binding and (Fe-S)-binding domain-containing protein [Halomarina sp. BCD28]
MATGERDPADDVRATYDYQMGAVDRPGLVDDLERQVDGEVRFDEYSRQLYATDASAYEVTPVGVVFPRDTDDVAAAVQYCSRRDVPVLPRGGGTSLAGQSVNAAVVLDFTRHMDGVVDVDPNGRLARAQAGTVLGELNAELAPYGLKFAPDPAWGDKSALGGAIGNNSTGAHSLVYGKTDYYLESVEAVLADGTVTTFGEISVDELREKADPDSEAWGPEGAESDLLPEIYREVVRIIDEEAEEVDEQYPDMKRNVSGYNLDVLVDEARGERRLPDDSGRDPDSEPGSVNLARLLAGSEGTLAVVTEATVSLVPVPETKADVLLTYDSLLDAMADVAPILDHGPAAVEVMDDVLLDLARETAEFRDVVGMLPEGTDAVLLVEFYAEDDGDGRQQAADLVADRAPSADTTRHPSSDRVETDAPHRAREAMEAHDPETQAKFWKMRKAGLPILLGRTTDEKHIAFIEDTAIPAENLPDYVADFEAILDDEGTFASYYAHAGPGVLHIRPLVNTKTVEGVEQLYDIADRATDLVVEYGGSVSGEHGDGRARTQWNRKLYGERLWNAFRDLKSAFDPDWLLNPGTVCGDVDMREHLRFSPEYDFEAGFDPTLDWDTDNGFQGMVELCHGCGGCRGSQDVTGGVMCPTYRAIDEEGLSTRGRANALRQAMSGDLDGPLDDEFVEEVLDLCIGCKGCSKDCPSEVDMAKMKAELEFAHKQRNGASLRDRLFANVDVVNRLGSAFAPLSNYLMSLPGAGTLQESLLGIARERSLPGFHSESFADWCATRDPAVSEADAARKVLLFPDTYTNYNDPAVGKAAVRVLEAAGAHVQVPDVEPSGRAAHSKGFLDVARERASANVETLGPRVEEGWDVVLVEPSDAVMLQSDYLDLLSGSAVETLVANSYGLCEYLDVHRLDEGMGFAGSGSLTYHGHCHQKSTMKDHHAVGVLRRAGYDVDPLDSGCCGMAGSFGYEAEHYSMSRAIGDVLKGQVDESPGDRVVAPGASCRSQLEEYDDLEKPPHPVQYLDAALSETSAN